MFQNQTVLFVLSSGPISSVLVNKYGSRAVMMTGGCVSGIGFVAASFCNSVEALYFCVGVMGGKFRFLYCVLFGLVEIKCSYIYMFFFSSQDWDCPSTSTLHLL